MIPAARRAGPAAAQTLDPPAAQTPDPPAAQTLDPPAAQTPDPPAAQTPDPATARLLHRTIATVREDFAALRFNTAIARLIELTAHASRLDRFPRALAEPLVLMVAPLAPHIAEELWQRLGHPASLAYEPFPQADPALAAEASVTLPVQVDGKVRFTIEVPASAGQQDIAEALASHPEYPRRRCRPPGHRPRQDRQRGAAPPGSRLTVRRRRSSTAGWSRSGTPCTFLPPAV